MPLKTEASDALMPNRPRPLAEAQLVILYLLRRLDSATDANLLDCLTEAEIMNYLEMMPALSRLVQEGALSETAEGAYRRYTVNESGKELLDLYGSRIPFSAREAIDRRLPEWREALRTQRDYQADMAQTPRGDFEVSLRMMERGRAVMSVSVSLPSSEIAARLCKRWQCEGGEVFRTLLRPLLEEEEP